MGRSDSLYTMCYSPSVYTRACAHHSCIVIRQFIRLMDLMRCCCWWFNYREIVSGFHAFLLFFCTLIAIKFHVCILILHNIACTCVCRFILWMSKSSTYQVICTYRNVHWRSTQTTDMSQVLKNSSIYIYIFKNIIYSKFWQFFFVK